ncbi:hypothetical protein MRX96_014107 [Rhipicephalus microplus]
MGHGRRRRSALRASQVLGSSWSLCLLTTVLLGHAGCAVARGVHNDSGHPNVDEQSLLLENGKPAGSLPNATFPVTDENEDATQLAQKEEEAVNSSSSLSWQHQQQLAAPLLVLTVRAAVHRRVPAGPVHAGTAAPGMAGRALPGARLTSAAC